MKCPACQVHIDTKAVAATENEEDLEIGFVCNTCGGDFYALLQSRDFVPVD